jgi:enamine deaminase RidA (YjgF/YER057c/UK114 family)
MRKLVSSGSPYEPAIGISRAVRAGSFVTVSGTAPLGPDGRTAGGGDPGAQARRRRAVQSRQKVYDHAVAEFRFKPC